VHEDLRMSGEARTWIAVTPTVAYAAVTDLPRMGEWSPENRGGEWIDPATGVAVGAMFRGHNRGPRGEWATVVTVTEAEPDRRFAFCVSPPGQVGTMWRYTFRADGEGTVVTEAFEWNWTPGDGFRGRVGRLPLAEATAAVAERERHLRAELEATLAALKHALEAPSPTD
jgi:Polyketide cyclase / dehydrase and lipid transport